MTVLTQLSVGAFATIWLLQLLGAAGAAGRRRASRRCSSAAWRSPPSTLAPRPSGARLSRAPDVAALVAEPRGAALRRLLRRSPAAYAGALWFGLPGGVVVGALTVALGLAGVTASACIYRVPARGRPGTRRYTPLQFNLTAARARAALRRRDRRRRRAGGWARSRRRWPSRSCVLLALRFLRAASPPTASSCAGTARLLSTVLAARARRARRAARRRRASCCRSLAGRPASGLAVRRPRGVCRGAGAALAGEIARPLSVLRQRRAEAHGRAVSCAAAREAA